MASRKISLFGKMQRGKSPSFKLFQLNIYEHGHLLSHTQNTPEACVLPFWFRIHHALDATHEQLEPVETRVLESHPDCNSYSRSKNPLQHWTNRRWIKSPWLFKIQSQIWSKAFSLLRSYSQATQSKRHIGLAKIRWPFHFKWCYINVILYSNNQFWWYILHCRDQKKSFPVIYNIIMLHVFIFVNLQKKSTKSGLFWLLCCCTSFFCELECVIIHFMSIKYSKIDILHFSEIIKLHSILYRFEIFEFLLKLCLKMCTPPFVI